MKTKKYEKLKDEFIQLDLKYMKSNIKTNKDIKQQWINYISNVLDCSRYLAKKLYFEFVF